MYCSWFKWSNSKNAGIDGPKCDKCREGENLEHFPYCLGKVLILLIGKFINSRSSCNYWLLSHCLVSGHADFCTEKYPCKENEGDCESNDDCMPGFACGDSNCDSTDDVQYESWVDCCIDETLG